MIWLVYVTKFMMDMTELIMKTTTNALATHNLFIIIRRND